MRPLGVVVADVPAEEAIELASGEDEHPVGALGPDGPHEAFRHGVGPW